MVLPFKEKFPWGEPTYFREKILAVAGYMWTTMMYPQGQGEPLIPGESFAMKGAILYPPKLHTIRKGNRWKAGDLLHMAYGVRTPNYNQFNKGIPELERVKSVQNISIKWYPGDDIHPNGSITVGVDGKIIDNVNQLAINDGFDDLLCFMKWFSKDFTGQIIHWTDLKY